MDGGSSFMPVPPNLMDVKDFISHSISGKLLRLEQPLTLRSSRDLIWMLLGKLLRL
jgi:hypothetical protein